MTKQQVERQSETILSHGLDAQGRLDHKLTTAVVMAVAKSNWSHKRALLRQMLRDVARIERQQTAVVTSAKALSENDKADLTKVLSNRYPNITAISWQHDESLLAGVTVQVGDTWSDMSVKNKLVQVQERLG